MTLNQAFNPNWLARLDELLKVGSADGVLDQLQGTTAPDDNSDPIGNGLAIASAVQAAGFPRLAIAAAREVWHRAPLRGDAAFRLCTLLLLNRNAEAQSVLAQCLAHFPEPSDGWVEIGEALLEAGQAAAALVCLARGTPGTALSVRRGLLARDLGRPAEARACFTDATRHDPTSARAWFLLGTAAEDAGDLADAAEAYRRVLALDPGRAEPAVNLGIVLQSMGDLAGAKAAYGHAFRGRPDTFGRIAQALPGAPRGELWLDLAGLRRALTG